jgi:hypothetical protein
VLHIWSFDIPSGEFPDYTPEKFSDTQSLPSLAADELFQNRLKPESC